MTQENQNFRFCPECGKETVSYVNSRHWVCASCGFDLYNNVAAAVGVIIEDREGRVLFIRRGKEPRKGFLALPGGFVDPGESAEEAARRECLEETSLQAEGLRYVTSAPNNYVYKTVAYTTCDVFFSAKVTGDFSPKAADGEAEGFAPYRVANEEDLAALPLAFPSARLALRAYLEQQTRSKH
jgi:ADP-ribose pyrophosphatase YjhB (NUDIX family)